MPSVDTRTESSTMVRVSVEVESEGSTFTVAARAKSIEGAVDLVKTLYSTDRARVVFPLDPESFFVEDGAESVHDEPVEIAS